ncbi:hypothetical protein KGF51_09780 [Clostridioides sp. ZZV14-6045]|nr:hypothetical protein [Clostridioides sp. ZZV14-6045]
MKGIDLNGAKKRPWELAHMQKHSYKMCIETVKEYGLVLNFLYLNI